MAKVVGKSHPEGSVTNEGTGIPYVNAYGNITKALENIKTASTPSRFTQDFLSTKLSLSGGSAKPVIPFLKRTGFLKSDGAPTELYKEFRNHSLSSIAAAKAVKIGYPVLYEINEYVHDLNDPELKGVIVQATGLDANSKTVKSMMASFKALRKFADFEAKPADIDVGSDEKDEGIEKPKGDNKKPIDLNLGYTINLNLPATSDIAVFDAIFKSLRNHLLNN